MRKETVFHAAEEQQRELEAFRRVQRHELHAVLVRLGLAVAGLEHGERQELCQRRQLAILGAHDLARRIHELFQVLDACLAADIGPLAVVRDRGHCAR